MEVESLKSLVEKAQKNDKNAINIIISKFSSKIEKSLKQTFLQERKDLKQEVCLKIIEAVYKYDLKSVPGFWDFYKNSKCL